MILFIALEVILIASIILDIMVLMHKIDKKYDMYLTIASVIICILLWILAQMGVIEAQMAYFESHRNSYMVLLLTQLFWIIMNAIVCWKT